MPTYVFDALDAQGKEIRSEIEASNEREAQEKIRAMKCYPTRIAAKAGGSQAPAAQKQPSGKQGQAPAKAAAVAPMPAGAPLAIHRKKSFSLSFRVSRKQLTQFTRQFSTLQNAGLPLVKSLDVLQNQFRPGLMKDTIIEVREDVEGGSALSDALAKHPRVFDRLYVSMVKAGEAGGVLDTILNRLADYMEKEQRLKSKIIGAMVYPAAVITIAAGILALIMIYIIPKFQDMFKEMNIPGGLPAPTKLLLAIATTMKDFWYLIIFLPVIILALIKIVGMSPRGRYIIDLIKLKAPVFGLIISKSSISRFCRTLGTLLQSGVPIIDALGIIKNTTGNAVVTKAVEGVHSSIREGDTIADPLRHSGVFDDLVVNMIQVGEETGEVDKMLIKIADTYDSEVDALVGGLMSLLEPILIVGLGVTVGFIVISLFLPLITIMEKLK